MKAINRFIPWYALFERVNSREQIHTFLHVQLSVIEATILLTDKERHGKDIYYLHAFKTALQAEITTQELLPF